MRRLLAMMDRLARELRHEREEDARRAKSCTEPEPAEWWCAGHRLCRTVGPCCDEATVTTWRYPDGE